MQKKTIQSSSQAKKMAYCGILAAMTVVFLYFGGQSVLDLSILVVCSFVTVFVAIEMGDRTAYIFAAATSTIALLLLPSKFYALEYILFSAIYPLIKPHVEKLPKYVSLAVKILILDVMLSVCIVIAQYVLGLGEEFFSFSFLTMILGTLFFVVYDFALTKCIVFYLVVLRKRLKIKKIL